MTSKTAKGRAATDKREAAEETTGVPAEAGRPEAGEPERAAGKKKVRRVRVIEVIDDEDLDEVLDAIDDDTATGDTDDEDEPPAAKARSRTASSSGGARKAGAAAETASGEDEGDAAAGDSENRAKRAGRRAGTDSVRSALASPRLTVALVVLVLAAVATWTTFQWRSVSAEEAERQKISAAAAKFGDIVYSYDPANVQAAIDQNRAMMAGDLLTQYTASTNSYKQFFAKNKWTWSSKTGKVYLSDVQDTLASAVIVIDINIKMTEGPYSVPAAHFTLGMVKQKGVWKVSSMKAAGSESATEGRQDSTGNLPGLTGDAKDTKPKN